jgi:aminotransferase EvaB
MKKFQVPLNDLSRATRSEVDNFSQICERVISSGVFLNGDYTKLFSKDLEKYFGVHKAFCLGNGTNALEIIMRYLYSKGKRSLVTAPNAGGYSTGAALLAGLKVRLIDVSNENALLELDTIVREYHSSKFDILVYTHLYGNTSEIAEISQFCRDKSIILVEDCAQAFGLKVGAKLVGSFGDFAALSFYPTKNLGAIGDAGAILISDISLNDIMSLSTYGWTNKYQIDVKNGTNSRIDEIQAALLSQKLNDVTKLNLKRNYILNQYIANLNPIWGEFIQTTDSVAHLAVLKCKDRQGFRSHLTNLGIESAIHYPIIDSDQSAWKGLLEFGDVSNAKKLSECIISIPIFPEMRQNEIDYVCAALAAPELQTNQSIMI